MNKYYQSELEKLREQTLEFAQAYPTIAPQLAQASTDPDVERILEGVAFLTAQIRQKIDDDFPEFAQGLLKQIFHITYVQYRLFLSYSSRQKIFLKTILKSAKAPSLTRKRLRV
jgi:hypothetical protein